MKKKIIIPWSWRQKALVVLKLAQITMEVGHTVANARVSLLYANSSIPTRILFAHRELKFASIARKTCTQKGVKIQFKLKATGFSPKGQAQIKSASLGRQRPPCRQGCKMRQGSRGSSQIAPPQPGAQMHQKRSPGPSTQAPPFKHLSDPVSLHTDMSHSHTEPSKFARK